MAIRQEIRWKRGAQHLLRTDSCIAIHCGHCRLWTAYPWNGEQTARGVIAELDNRCLGIRNYRARVLANDIEFVDLIAAAGGDACLDIRANGLSAQADPLGLAIASIGAGRGGVSA